MNNLMNMEWDMHVTQHFMKGMYNLFTDLVRNVSMEKKKKFICGVNNCINNNLMCSGCNCLSER